MKRKLILGIALFLMIGLIVGCSGASDKDQGDGQTKGKVYQIATDTTFAPFEFQNDAGEYVGIDIDLLKAIAEDQDFKYELKPLGFNAAVAALESNQADAVIAGMSITDERKEKYNFSEPYFDSGVVMAVSDANKNITSYKDLEGKKVAVKTGTEGASFAESIKEEYGFELTYFEESSKYLWRFLICI